MEFRQATVHDQHGRAHPAYVAACRACGCEKFYVFQLSGQNHFHLQCVKCGESYCPFGACEPPS